MCVSLDETINVSKSFGSFDTIIVCISHVGFESQFQKAFTHTKVKEFHVKVASMMCFYCFLRWNE